jgi:hypothetical protein
MDSYLMFLNCPAYMDKNGAARCGLPAEVHCRYTMNSTDGPLESAKISCPPFIAAGSKSEQNRSI